MFDIEFARFVPRITISVVRRLRNILFVALALAWAPITSHCQLEILPALDFLACCGHDDESAPHHDNDCQQDACAAVESGHYKTQDPQLFVDPPMLALLLNVRGVCADAGDRTSRIILAAAPPEQLHTWQFVLRAALPVRAPSIVS